MYRAVTVAFVSGILAAAHANDAMAEGWSGPYAGLVVAYGAGDQQQYEDAGSSPVHDVSGAAAGVTAGYNFARDSMVFGVEADAMWSSISGSFSGSYPPWGCGVANGCQTEFDWISTVRARMGVDAGRVMPFVTAGAAFAGLSSKDAISLTHYDMDEVAVGWTVGAGVEMAINDGLSIKTEGLYADFGKTADSVAPSGFGVDSKLFMARLGLTYRF